MIARSSCGVSSEKSPTRFGVEVARMGGYEGLGEVSGMVHALSQAGMLVWIVATKPDGFRRDDSPP